MAKCHHLGASRVLILLILPCVFDCFWIALQFQVILCKYQTSSPVRSLGISFGSLLGELLVACPKGTQIVFWTFSRVFTVQNIEILVSSCTFCRPCLQLVFFVQVGNNMVLMRCLFGTQNTRSAGNHQIGAVALPLRIT